MHINIKSNLPWLLQRNFSTASFSVILLPLHNRTYVCNIRIEYNRTKQNRLEYLKTISSYYPLFHSNSSLGKANEIATSSYVFMTLLGQVQHQRLNASECI